MQLRWALVLSSVLAAYVAAASSEMEAASQVLNSAYAECAPTWSHTCLQKKVLVFVDRLDGVRSIPLLDGWTVETVSGTPSAAAPITEQELASLSEGRAANSAALDDVLSDMLDNRLSHFFQHRVLRMSVPQQVAAVFNARGLSNQLPSVDFSLGEANENGEGNYFI
jgi:Protein of unknown function (DUF1676)